MNSGINKLYNAIDNLFEGKKNSEKIILYSLAPIICSFLSYQFLYPPSQISISAKKANKEALEKELKYTNSLLQTKNEIIRTIEQNEQSNRALGAKLDAIINEKKLITDKFLAVSFINMNDKNSLEFVNYLTMAAAKNGVTISQLRAKINTKENGVFKKELIADINCSGGFNGILSYINDIEASNMFSKINSCRIKHGIELNASICVKISGI